MTYEFQSPSFFQTPTSTEDNSWMVTA